MICYKASIALHPEEANILNELYERVAAFRIDNEDVHSVMGNTNTVIGCYRAARSNQ